MRESRASTIVLDSVSADALSRVVAFLYGARVDLTPENCVEVLALSDLYDLGDLKLVCELFLSHLVDVDPDADPETTIHTINEILDVASTYNAPRLTERALDLRADRHGQRETP